MSSFTYTLTGGSQFAICNLRNLRGHFFSKFRVKKVSGNTAFTYTERVDTRGVVVLDLLTVPFMSTWSVNCQLFWKRHGSSHIFAFSIFEKWSGNLENLPRIFVVSKKKCIFVPSSRRKRLKTAGKDHRKAFLWRCGTPYMEKAYITRFVLDVSKA